MRTLNRPMFRRGGSTGGITANLKTPRQGFVNAGSVQQYPNLGGVSNPFYESEPKFLEYSTTVPEATASASPEVLSDPKFQRSEINTQGPDFASIMAQYMSAPEKPKGMSTSDYLRLAAAGAEIMGATPTSDGSGFLAALSSAGPALSGAAKDIASNISTRNENYKNRLDTYNASLADAAMRQAEIESEREFEVDVLDAQMSFDFEKMTQEQKNAIELIKEEALANPYQYEEQYRIEKGNELLEDARKAIENEDYDAYLIAKNKFINGLYSQTSTANTEEKANLLSDDRFLTLVSDQVDNIMDGDRAGTIYEGKTETQITAMITEQMFATVISEVYFPDFPGMAKGGRVGMQEGGTTNVQMEPSSADIQLTYEELRKRLPPEVSDGVINLIMNSEQAMIDFAQLMTPEDIAVFNDKYNVDLQYPTQVA